MRRYYIDNIRNLGILLLFPFHTCRIYNSFQSFYVHGNVVQICNDFILFTAIWFMPLLFLLAGMSSYYALQKRSWKEYLRERFYKLFIPLLFGVLLIVPVQTYYAEKFHNNYQGGYFEQYILFLTKITDLTGYHGGFTPAHLWFLLYLFIIVLIALPMMLKVNKTKKMKFYFYNNPVKIIFFFIIPFLFYPVLDIGGKSLGHFFTIFIIGFLLCKEERILDTVEKYRLLYFVLTLLATISYFIIFYSISWESRLRVSAIIFNLFRHFVMWISILTILGYGKKYMNFSNKITAYLTKASFPLYVFHQTVLVVIAYYMFKLTDIFIIQFIFILILGFILSVLSYEIFKQFRITRFIFGIKK